MSRESVLARGQAAAESGMTDTCVIKRKTGETTGAGGVITPTWTTLYTGQKCRVQVVIRRPGIGQDTGEAYRVIEHREVQLPMSVTGLQEGDSIQVTTSADPDLVGRVYTVRDVLAKTHATARRVTVLEITS
jgi:hypothetical protein